MAHGSSQAPSLNQSQAQGEKGKKGVFGGTFDPIHWAHLLVAEEVRVRLGLAEVIFVPTNLPWRKATSLVTPPDHRLAMVRLAVASNPFFRVSTVDLDRGGPSYTLDTIKDLQREIGEGAKLYFILGWDALVDLPHWREPARIAQMCQLVAIRRPGLLPGKDLDWGPIETAVPDARSRILLLDVPQLDISSTEVRRRVAQGLSIRYWVPDAVADYIQAHGLY